MKEKRPVNLDLTGMRFPVTAITSILHRITGLVLFLALPFMIWMLQMSVSGEAEYYNLINVLREPLLRFVSWALAVAAGYHVIAGLRHILMDVGLIKPTVRGGALSSWVVLGLAVAFAVFAGVKLW